MGKKETYIGYGPEQGVADLRKKIATKLYNGLITPDEVFVSDGAKCDILRLQIMFGSKVVSAVQDPSYPVYVDTSVMFGLTGEFDEGSRTYLTYVHIDTQANIHTYIHTYCVHTYCVHTYIHTRTYTQESITVFFSSTTYSFWPLAFFQCDTYQRTPSSIDLYIYLARRTITFSLI